MVQRRLSTTAEGLARRSLPWVAHDAEAPHSATRLLLVSAMQADSSAAEAFVFAAISMMLCARYTQLLRVSKCRIIVAGWFAS
jgi:hypothetical protein